ncbi:MAG: thioredoxin domain-containing protein [Deltaproteobacteria bacterium]|nr:thioredoxin domain-containing protein [Deltaproteobacteria bacterium]MBP6830952.1 thioredoxin domain-containing protein [Deltaproteobacteria bacterium]
MALLCDCRRHRPSRPASARPRRDASAVESPVALRERLQRALAARGPGYVPRTRHRNPDGAPRHTNRLILESSPYLQQHAHNPVDWYPWGDEAFARARALGRPIFLSVGYSTCHWCHVMEEESFEDEEVARYLNDHYVAIKVDREERPDVDAVYMAFLQAIAGSGGWPMSVWLTPAREPFFAGTYFPPRAGVRGSRRGLLDVLAEQGGRFAAAPQSVVAEAQRLVGRLRVATAPEPAGDFPSASLLASARAAAASRFDAAYGGSRGAPKFPSSFPNRLLLRTARRSGDREDLRRVTETLQRMRAGGIYDQVGGGFHRYSTDERWRVPHFEKMLYDNALLAVEYLEAGQATGDASFLATTRETLDYLLRDMRSADGVFFSATDADSLSADGRREEGLFFTWTPSELRAALGDADAAVARAWFGVDEQGQLEGRSVLRAERPIEEVARELGLSPAALRERLAAVGPRMLAIRSRRPAPLRDEKVIVAWNGLAVSAFARAAIVLGDATYAEAAVRAARALTAPLHEGRALPHAFVGGQAQGRAFADDHVSLAAALLDVFELTADPRWLSDAVALMDSLERSFADPERGGYYLTADHHERLLLRERPDYDGPVPSVNSVAALTSLRLLALTGDGRFQQRAEMTLRAFSSTLAARPLALDQMLLALDWATDAAREIVVVVPEGSGALATGARPFLDLLRRSLQPNTVLVVATEADLSGDLGRLVPSARGKRLRAGQATAYVCERGSCRLPTSDPRAFATLLAEVRP